MLYAAFCITLLIAAVLHQEDKKTLALCLTVGAGFFSPLPNNDWLMFYISGVATELCVAYAAWSIRCAASQPIMIISVLMAACHVAGAILDGYPALSAYRILIPFFEIMEPVSIILLSPVLCRLLHNHESPPL